MAKDKHRENKKFTAPGSATSSDTRSSDANSANNPKPTINGGYRNGSGSGTVIDTVSPIMAIPTRWRTRGTQDLRPSDALQGPDFYPAPVIPNNLHRDVLHLRPGEWPHPVEPYDRNPTPRPRYMSYGDAHVARRHPVLPVPLDTKPTFKVTKDRKLRIPFFPLGPFLTKPTPTGTEVREAIPITKPLPPATASPHTGSLPKVITDHELLHRLGSQDLAPPSSSMISTNTDDSEKAQVGLQSRVAPSPVATLPSLENTDLLVPIILTTDANSNSIDNHLSHEILLLNPSSTSISTLTDAIFDIMLSGTAESNLKLQGKLLGPNAISVAWESGILRGTVTTVHEGNVKAVLALLGKSLGKEGLSVMVEEAEEDEKAFL